MNLDLTLAEYETRRVQLRPGQERRLSGAGEGAITVRVAPEPGWFDVTATHLVGTLVVDDMRVLIRPKIRPENLFLMLEVGLKLDAWRREAFDYAADHDLLPSVIAFFARTL